MKIKISKIIRILLGIDFILLALSVIFMRTGIFGLNVKQFHPIFGIILLSLGVIHITLQCLMKKDKK
jgi:hypothetical protein